MSERNERGAMEADYHRHASGDVVPGPAERCIDPSAGAKTVVVMTLREFTTYLANAKAEALREAAGSEFFSRHAGSQRFLLDFAGTQGNIDTEEPA